ncbi:MAG TPA: ubiquitin-like small modifier protein 1 [Methanomicrobiales archaeon]|nr:ubiquitin-like small modifier protein 1 [Methanomicrobiales archaeon]
MKARVRFFARFRELLGTDIVVEPRAGTSFAAVVREVAGRKKEGYNAIFDEKGTFRDFVILMRNGKRVEAADAEKILIADGDEIAVFPPVSGG